MPTLTPKRTEKPWGHELLWALTDSYAGKLLYISKGESLSLQYHEEKEETILVIEGTLQLEIEEDGLMATYKMEVEESRHIAPGAKHRMIAVDDCIIAEVSTPQLDDVVRITDKYGRV